MSGHSGGQAFEDDDYDDDIKLDDVKRSKTITLSIKSSYTGWGPRDAFRELIQNMRDAIIEQYNLSESEFTVIREEKVTGQTEEIIYKIPMPPSKLRGASHEQWLGWIYYKGGPDGGTVEITNRGSVLLPEFMDLGYSTKRGVQNQAGTHGEGMKLGVLVLLREPQNHCVQCHSGNFKWSFNFSNRARLLVRLIRLTPNALEKINKASRDWKDTLLPAVASPANDVRFTIGEIRPAIVGRSARDLGGRIVTRRAVLRRDFEEWAAAALFLQESRHKDNKVIRTDSGDLLIGPGFQGKIYLKGLLLRESTRTQSASITRKRLKFGYNFATGTTNRERQHVTADGEESKSILNIWSKALLVKPELTSELHDVLNHGDEEFADVYGANRTMNKALASLLRDHLFRGDNSGKWYYSEKEKSENSRLEQVIEGFGRTGVKLKQPYWDALAKWGLVSNANEEERKRFLAAQPAMIPYSKFARSLDKLMRSCIKACPYMSTRLEIRYVQAGSLDLNVHWDPEDGTPDKPERLIIHERWLDCKSAAAELGVNQHLDEANIVLHSVRYMFTEALKQMPRESFCQRETPSRSPDWIRQSEAIKAEQRLLCYLRLQGLRVIAPLLERRSLRIDLPSSGGWSEDTMVEVYCLREDQAMTHDVLLARDVKPDTVPYQQPARAETSLLPATRCRKATIPFSRRSHTEGNLEPGTSYFFMISIPSDPTSFVVYSDMAQVREAVREPQRRSSLGSDESRGSVNGDDDDLYSADVDASRMSDAVSSDDNPPGGQECTMHEADDEPDVVELFKKQFSLGPRLTSVDILSVPRTNWFTAQGAGNEKAIIGLLGQDEDEKQPQSRKRPKLEPDSDHSDDYF